MMRRWLVWLFFNLKYLQNPPWDTGISPPELLDFIQNHPPGRALDLGCGTGTNLVTLARAGWQVAGGDYALLAVAQARRRLRDAGFGGTPLFIGDVTKERKWPHLFDLVLDIGCYHGLSQEGKRKYLLNLTKVLAPGGCFLLYGHLSEGRSAFGIVEQDILDLQSGLRLADRKDGMDQNRPSVWLTYYTGRSQ